MAQVKQRQRQSLVTKISWPFLAVIVISLLIVGGSLTLFSWQAQRQQILENQSKSAEFVATTIALYLQQAQGDLKSLAQVASLEEADLEQQATSLKVLWASRQETLVGITLLNAKGQELAKYSTYHTFLPSEFASQRESKLFQQAIAGQVYIADKTETLPDSPSPIIRIGMPIQKSNRSVVGVIAAEVSVKAMLDIVQQTQIGQTGYAYVIDQTGQLIAHKDQSRFLQLKGQALTDVPLVAQIIREPEARGAGEYRGLDGDRVVGAHAAIGTVPWHVIVELPTAEAYQPIQRMIVTLIVLLLGILAFAVTLGAWLPRRLIRPLNDLAQVALRLGQGDLSRRIGIKSNDELETLAETFNSMADQLQQTLTGLEQRVAERTAEISQANKRLSRQTNQLQASAQVSRAATTLVDPDQLIPRVVELIQQRFGFYYAGLFLVDQDNRYVVLEVGTGEAGHIMKERGHRLEIGGQSMVGWTCANKKARIALDVGQEPVRFANPLLPDTHSEMALPLLAGERVLGALDVQSTEVAAFDESDIAALQGMADQIAVALENARLFRQTQATLRELEKTNRAMVREGWEGYLDRQAKTRHAEFAPPSAPAAETLAEALSIPLELRGQPIGRLTLRREGDHPWSDEEVDMLRAIALQTVLAADNIRLFDEAQRLAQRERMINEVTARIRGSLTLEGILNSAIRELSHVTGARYGKIKLEMAETN